VACLKDFQGLSFQERQEIASELGEEERRTLIESLATSGPSDEMPGSGDQRTTKPGLFDPAKNGITVAIHEPSEFPPESVGSRMSGAVIALRPYWTADEAIDVMRGRASHVRHAFYPYVVNEDEELIGVVSLRNILTAPPSALVASIMSANVVDVPAFSDQELAAQRLRDHHLLALPVLDRDQRLCGAITADDVLHIQVQEDTEDMYKMAGIGIQERAFSPVWESATRRVPWLAFNMAWAFAGAFIISLFEGTLQKVAVLAVFMPMIAGQCGNAGIQTATIVVRSMALGELNGKVIFRLLRKEWALSLIKGAIFGTILGLVAWLWKGEAFLGLVAGTAMLFNMLVAGTTGVVLPLTLRRLGFDPATIAGVFDTMLTDLMGFLIYLGLATLLISHLT
jgi:magnesium transporter